MYYKPTMMDANFDYESSKYFIFGAPFDGTSSFRSGSRWAPDAMRQASLNFESYNQYYNVNLNDIPIHDAGNFEIESSIENNIHDLFSAISVVVNDNKLPIMLGGEHSLSFPCIKACDKNISSKLGVIVLDAHLDLREEYSGTKYNHACVSRHIIEEITDNYVSIGVRSGSQEEWEYAEQNQIKHYTSEDVHELGISTVVKESIEYLNADMYYLSLDMDVLDPSYAPGLGTPEPFGLNSFDVKELVHRIAPDCIGFDIVEISPNYDYGETALLGTKIMREFIASHASANLLK
ncbi:agmatinase [Methanosalsum natronophilum]|nr:agmatinase [Methanosalsum natronophilum]MCS3924011.1 agmatinase [Methanosalsum natronophilum]